MRFFAFVAAIGLAGLWASPATADGLSAQETARLLRGEAVSRTQRLDQDGRHYVGGVTYAIVDAAPAELATLVDNVDNWRKFLPRTRDAMRVGQSGGDPLVEVTHGSTLLSVAYTLRMHREGDLVSFWMDPARPHDITDTWGFLRATAMPDHRTLLAWGILVDVGPGLLRDLFEDKVQTMALQVPQRVRDMVVAFRLGQSDGTPADGNRRAAR